MAGTCLLVAAAAMTDATADATAHKLRCTDNVISVVAVCNVIKTAHLHVYRRPNNNVIRATH